jgi:threonylcarbamoyladenosine tRNA methylthiotransferase MtaB
MVSRVVPNLEKDHLVADLLHIPHESFDLEPLARQPVPGSRLRTRAFIKVQDGCDNRCTFCITTIARGQGRSRLIDEVLADIHSALEGGCQEVVLTGVHLGSWGHDLTPSLHLRNLVQEILRQTDAPRLRLSSLEPWDLDTEFFSLWKDPRLCRHLHLPLQSGSAATLRRMARKTTPESFASLVAAARLAIPGVAITTDVIAGFPGESEAEFAESLEFVRRMRFAGGHVFTYSARPGTAAARMPEQVPHPVRKERNAQMRHILGDAALEYQGLFLGSVLPVLWESTAAIDPQGWRMSGLTDNYLRVTARAGQHLWNRITPVRLTALDNEGIVGTVES